VLIRRGLLRLAYALSKLLPHLRKRAPLGAAVAVRWNETILVVRHSYRPGWSLPGGRVKRGETAERAAQRELEEEVGLHARLDELRPAYATLSLRIFEFRPEGEPEPRVDGREIVEARLVEPAAVEDADKVLAGYLLAYVPDSVQHD
jgi:8-oxo-dGTP pyrophosphatase MutT (NUDIX family)